jgi:hypothetical protein
LREQFRDIGNERLRGLMRALAAAAADPIAKLIR